MLIFSVYDKKAKSFNTPFFSLNHDVAKRQFVELCRDARTVVARNPEDYDLFCLGSFADETGALTPCPPTASMTGVEARVAALRLEKLQSELLQVAATAEGSKAEAAVDEKASS